MTLLEVRRRHVELALAACRGNQRKAAMVLGVDRKTVARWLAQWGESAQGDRERSFAR